MAPPPRPRPVSATSATSNSTAANGSTISYFTDRSAILGLEGGAKQSDRPLPEMLNLLVDAAHRSYENRKVLHPPTYAYSLFNWRVSGSSQQGGPPPSQSPSMASGGHSSTAVYAWGESSAVGPTTAPGPAPGPKGSVSYQLSYGISPTPSRLGVQPSEALGVSYWTSSVSVGNEPSGPSGAAGRSASARRSGTAGGGGSSSGGGAAAATAAAAAAGAASGLGVDRPPRSIVRPAVVAKSLAPWEGSELEVVCLYDCNFQTANRQGQQGIPLRLAARTPQIGPISYLYRWYCKRATQFRSQPGPADLLDAPTMPPPQEEPWTRAAAAGGGAAGSGGTRSGRAASSGSGTAAVANGGGVGGGTSAALWLRHATSAGSGSAAGAAGAGASSGARREISTTAASGNSGGGGGSSGRRLNLSLDPVISLSEVVDLLEDLQVVPQRASRLDITKLFNAARHAAAAAAAATLAAGGDPKQQQSLRAGATFGASTATKPTHGAASAAGRSSSPSRKARPSSAPRACRPTSAVGAAAAAGSIPRPQPHPDEVRFPVFKDILVRLAVALACSEPASTSSSVAAAAAAATTTPATASAAAAAARASSMGGVSPVSYGWGRTLSGADALAGVRRLLGLMHLERCDVRGLKQRLERLARWSSDHHARAQANKRRYVGVPSPVAAAQDVTVAAAAAPPPPTARPSRPAPPWGVLAATPAPSYLLAVLAEEDQSEEEEYQPMWREFGSVALELGVLQPGELRQCRVMLHSRGPHTLEVRIDGSAAPFCRCSHMGLHSLPPGMPLRLDLAVRLAELGEVVGELRLYYSSSQDRREREIVVPVYGMVCPPSGSATAGRSRPVSASERSAMAAKATREAVVPAVVRGALAAAPLGHCGPRQLSSRWSSSSSSVGAVATGGGGAGSSVGAATPQRSHTSIRWAWTPPTTTTTTTTTGTAIGTTTAATGGGVGGGGGGAIRAAGSTGGGGKVDGSGGHGSSSSSALPDASASSSAAAAATAATPESSEADASGSVAEGGGPSPTSREASGAVAGEAEGAAEEAAAAETLAEEDAGVAAQGEAVAAEAAAVTGAAVEAEAAADEAAEEEGSAEAEALVPEPGQRGLAEEGAGRESSLEQEEGHEDEEEEEEGGPGSTFLTASNM